MAKRPTATTTLRVEGNIVELRNTLRVRIRSWQEIHPIYMPGLCLYQSKVSNPVSSHQAEDIKLWLPSDIPFQDRDRVCVENLANMEARLRTAQCSDALNNIRHVLKLKSRMVAFKNKNVRGQKDGTRSRAVIDRVHERARAAAEKYRVARKAKLSLEGPGPWESEFRILEDGDIRSYQDPNPLQPRQPRRGIFEDDACDMNIDAGIAPEPGSTADEDCDISLYNDIRSRRDGTGETRRVLSWIWLTPNADHSDRSDDILRIEWAKSRARAARSREEVLLLKEEMRRVLAFLDWKGNQWRLRAQGTPECSDALFEGKQAFSWKQGDIQSSLSQHFRYLWTKPLNEMAGEIFEESRSEARENGCAQGPCATEGDDDDEDYNEDEDDEDEDDEDEDDEDEDDDKNEEEFCYMDEAEDDD